MSRTGKSISLLRLPRRLLLFLAFCLALLAILAIGFVSYTEMSVLANSSARVQRSYDVLQTLHDLNTALTDTETNQRGFLLTQDSTYLDQYDAALAEIRLALTELRRLSGTGLVDITPRRGVAVAAPASAAADWQKGLFLHVDSKIVIQFRADRKGR